MLHDLMYKRLAGFQIAPVEHGEFLALRHVCVVPMEIVTERLGSVYVTLGTMGPTVIKVCLPT